MKVALGWKVSGGGSVLNVGKVSKKRIGSGKMWYVRSDCEKCPIHPYFDLKKVRTVQEIQLLNGSFSGFTCLVDRLHHCLLELAQTKEECSSDSMEKKKKTCRHFYVRNSLATWNHYPSQERTIENPTDWCKPWPSGQQPSRRTLGGLKSNGFSLGLVITRTSAQAKTRFQPMVCRNRQMI